ncbi:radical SAM protein [Candidatus Borrarchaeum sp.]|uniref:radical SAM protein n=1 Tax=Candidatus Borrarchaeum sp. TaxID=2846742 RepID=UPI00257DF4F9|nr:radical SAM protein [Candidatus Borrarchaeum sp.]
MDEINELLRKVRESCDFKEVFRTRGIRITNKCIQKPLCYYCNYMNEDIYFTSVEEVISRALELKNSGVDRVTLVSGWLGYNNKLGVRYVKAIRDDSRFDDLRLSAAFGRLSKSSLLALKKAGLDQYGCNLEGVPEILVKIKGINDFEERINTLECAREVGLDISTGFIIGVGEDWKMFDRLLRNIKELDPCSIFMSPFEPYPNTPMENFPPSNLKRVIKAIAKTKLAFPEKIIGVRIIMQCKHLPREIVSLMIYAGANLIAPPPAFSDRSVKEFFEVLKTNAENLNILYNKLINEGVNNTDVTEFIDIVGNLNLV